MVVSQEKYAILRFQYYVFYLFDLADAIITVSLKVKLFKDINMYAYG